VVTRLFDYWIEDPERLPAGYIEQIKTEAPARIVADYIAGMTDSYILGLFEQMESEKA
jgi:dGTPase